MCVDLSSLLDANHVSVWLIAISRQPSSRAGCADCHFLVFVGAVCSDTAMNCAHTHTIFLVLLLYHAVSLSHSLSLFLFICLANGFLQPPKGVYSHYSQDLYAKSGVSVNNETLGIGCLHNFVVPGESVLQPSSLVIQLQHKF